MSIVVSGIPCALSGETNWKETAKILHKIATFYLDCIVDSSTLDDTESFENCGKALTDIKAYF
jgi:hypothetical protein